MYHRGKSSDIALLNLIRLSILHCILQQIMRPVDFTSYFTILLIVDYLSNHDKVEKRNLLMKNVNINEYNNKYY